MVVLLAGAVVIFLSILLLPGMIGEVTGTAAGLATIGFLFRFLKKSSRNPKEKHNAPERRGRYRKKKRNWTGSWNISGKRRKKRIPSVKI
jgi:hypothetical protein